MPDYLAQNINFNLNAKNINLNKSWSLVWLTNLYLRIEGFKRKTFEDEDI